MKSKGQVRPSFKLLLLGLVLGAGLVGGAGNLWAASQLIAQDGRFLDPQGRSIQLRGVNVSGAAKNAPFIPFAGPGGEPDLTKLDPLPGWGINVIRLLFVWQGFEPEPGKYDDTYLERLAKVAEAAWARGIYVLVEFHQDSFSRFTGAGCGSGFPYWVVPEEDRVKPVAHAECTMDWAFKTVPTRRLHRAFHAFFQNRRGVRDAYLKAMGKLVHRFRANPGVLGYDLLNEPWGFEKSELFPLFQDAAKVVRAEDPKAMVFVSPHISTLVGFTQSSMPDLKVGNLVYSPHFYDIIANNSTLWTQYASAPMARHAHAMMKEKANAWKAPLFMGEYGACVTTPNLKKFFEMQSQVMDRDFTSGTQWGYTPEWNNTDKDGWNGEDMSIVDDHGKLRDNFILRPLAVAVAGEPLNQKTITDDQAHFKSYELEWIHNPKQGSTEVYVPSELLENPKLQLSNEKSLKCELNSAAHKLTCSSQVSGSVRLRLDL